MKYFKFFLVLSITLGIFYLSGCTKKEADGKIPITTSSDKALQDFLKGRELSENLLGQESLQYFEAALNKDPNFALARYYYVLAQPTARGFFDELEKAVALADQVSEGERLWIEGLQAGVNGMPAKQREMYQEMCDLYPNDERAHGQFGNYYFGQQMYKEAIGEYEKAIQINPDYPQVYNQLGYSNRQLGNYGEAEKAFAKYTELIPNNPNPYDSYAELKMKMGQFEASIDLYQKALEVNQNFVASHVGIASNYNFLGEHQKAREQLETLLKIARNNGERRAAHFAMVVSYVDEGNYEQALNELTVMYNIARETNDAPAMAGDLANMGNILYEMEKFDEAQKNYDMSVKTIRESGLEKEVIDNAERFYLYNTGRVALKKGNLKLSKDKCEQFMAAASEVKNTFQLWLAHELEGIIALREKEYEKAIEELNQANQQNPYTFYRIAMVYEKIGDAEKAQKFYERAATDNTLNSLNYAFIRTKATEKMM
jgi:tetratricopeptide (TPR) repeat protein